MVDVLLVDWVEEFNSLSDSELRSYASEQVHNNETVVALYTVFDEHVKYTQLIDSVCKQLYSYYRSGEEELQRFTMQFIPALVLLYLENVSHGDRQICRSVETLLIGVYNLEIVDKTGMSKVISFRIPSIAQPSIYHERTTLSPAFLTASSLRRWEECNTKLVNWGPLPQVEYLNAQNRLRVMTALLFIYNRQLGSLSGTSLEHLCKVCSRLVTQGFHSSGAHVRLSIDSDNSCYSTQLIPRVALSSQLLLELLHTIYFAISDGNTMSATQALEDIYNRACYESYTDVLLVANSIKNLIQSNRSGVSDGIINMNLAQPTPPPSVSVSKSMITNASFRIKKLPDDIPIQLDKEDGEGTGLVAISEEKEEEEKAGPKSSAKGNKESSGSSALSGVKHLPKTFSGLGKKVKESKANLKNSNQSLDKDKGDITRKSIDIEKDAAKHLKDEATLHKPAVDEIEFKRIISVDSEKVSLVSDSMKSNSDIIDNVATNGATRGEGYNEIMVHNAVHVSSV